MNMKNNFYYLLSKMIELDWWDWSTFVVLSIVIGFWIGLIYWNWFLKKKAEHGPNSSDWRGKITKENDGYYLWEIDICPCPCV